MILGPCTMESTSWEPDTEASSETDQDTAPVDRTIDNLMGRL